MVKFKAFKPIEKDNLLKAGNTITQRSFRSTFNEVVVKLDLAGMVKGQKSGLTHFGSPSYASLGVVFNGIVKRIEYNVKGAITLGDTVTTNQLWLKSNWSLDGLSQFYYSTDGIKYAPFGNPYQLMWGSYRGDRIGIYNYNNESDTGYLDVDYFSYLLDKSQKHIK